MRLLTHLFFMTMAAVACFGAATMVSAGSLGEGILQQTKNVSGQTFKIDSDPKTTIFSGISRAVSFIIGILGVIAVGLIVYSGFLWMTAGGNDQQIAKAKNIIKMTVIGILIISAAYMITTFVIRQIAVEEKEEPRQTRRVSTIPFSVAELPRS